MAESVKFVPVQPEVDVIVATPALGVPEHGVSSVIVIDQPVKRQPVSEPVSSKTLRIQFPFGFPVN